MGSTNTVKPETERQRKSRLEREAKDLEKQAKDLRKQATATVGQPTEEDGPSALRKVGTAIIDADLRKLGQATKRFGRFVKDHTPSISVEKAHDCGDESCPHGNSDAA